MNRFKNIKFTRKNIILLILLAPIIAVLVYGLLIRPVQVRLEQQKFKDAEVFLEEKRAEIEKLVGPADKTEKINSCGYSSAKFSKGTLYCSVKWDNVYAVEDVAEANKLMIEASSISNDPLYRYGENTPRIEEEDERYSRTITQQLRSQTQPECKTHYNYVTENNNEKFLSIFLSCSKQAMTEIYPVRE